MLLVPITSILATLAMCTRVVGPDFHIHMAEAAGGLSILVGLALLFLGLPFRRRCRRKGRNSVGWWLLQWLLVFLPAGLVFATLQIWWSMMVALQLLAYGLLVALVAWFVTDCRPLKPPPAP